MLYLLTFLLPSFFFLFFLKPIFRVSCNYMSCTHTRAACVACKLNYSLSSYFSEFFLPCQSQRFSPLFLRLRISRGGRKQETHSMIPLYHFFSLSHLKCICFENCASGKVRTTYFSRITQICCMQILEMKEMRS